MQSASRDVPDLQGLGHSRQLVLRCLQDFDEIPMLECRGAHQMIKFFANNEKGAKSYECDGCGVRCKFPMFSCPECSFDLCLACAKAGVNKQGAPYAPPVEHCPDGERILFAPAHPENPHDPKLLNPEKLAAQKAQEEVVCCNHHHPKLFENTFDDGFPKNYCCPGCNSTTETPAWICEECDWVKCAKCVRKEEDQQPCCGLTDIEGHPLVLSHHDDLSCCWCGKNNCHPPYYVCQTCRYVLCRVCLSGRTHALQHPDEVAKSPLACPNGHGMRFFNDKQLAGFPFGVECFCCGRKGALYHACTLCGYAVCSDCADKETKSFSSKPSDIPRSEVPCKAGHQMVIYEKHGMKGGPTKRISCDVCGQTEKYPATVCWHCNWVICDACEKKRFRAKQEAEELPLCPVSCPAGHAMRWYEDRTVTGAPWPHPKCFKCHREGSYPQFGCWQCGVVLCPACWEEIFTRASRSSVFGTEHSAIGPQYCNTQEGDKHVMSEITCESPTRRFVCCECHEAAAFPVQLCQRCCYAVCSKCLQNKLAEGNVPQPPELRVMFEQKIDCTKCKGLVEFLRSPSLGGEIRARDQCSECGMACRWPMSMCSGCGTERCCHCTEKLARKTRQHNQQEDEVRIANIKKAEEAYEADTLAKAVRFCHKEHLLHRTPFKEVSKDGVDWTCSRCEVRYRVGDVFRCGCEGANICVICVMELTNKAHASYSKDHNHCDHQAVFTTGKGSVVAWGKNSSQLGLADNERAELVPWPQQLLGFPAQSSVVQVCARGDYSAALLADGTVWTWGYNWECQLGTGDQGCREDPCKVKGLPCKALQIATGKDFMMAVLQNGEVWGWGSNELGQLGVQAPPPPPKKTTRVMMPNGRVVYIEEDIQPPPDYRGKPLRIPWFEEKHVKVACIYAGASFIMAVSEAGDLYSWGKNNRGQLGLGKRCGGCLFPEKLQAPWAPYKIADVACGESHVVLLADNGKIFCWGNNDQGQLGQGAVGGEPMARPHDLQLPGPAAAVACGSHHSVALLKSGEVLCWGANEDGQLGINPGVDMYEGRRTPRMSDNDRRPPYDWRRCVAPQKAKTDDVLPKGDKITAIACGDHHTIALLQSGELIEFGRNDTGQLALGDTTKYEGGFAANRPTPTLLSHQRLGGAKIAMVAAGTFHTVALVSN
eukprot:TRINITY_DN3206_c0_g1_i2.p1 TRINITY_DN3206_c0_g1~~TRINITY_DN3206_c0_g1_i2.p1  ORF type:complete len:1161 (-),score=241.41 TRINITY_DN3206_c0_g1_i2:34-3516(-)